MSSRVFRRIPACDPELVALAGKAGVADLLEAMGPITGRQALLDPAIGPLTAGLSVAGQAVTVCGSPGDGLFGHYALTLAEPGQILVTASAGPAAGPMFAELVSLAARERGVAGVVVDGPVRDSDALRASRFPVWCRGTYAGNSAKRGPGEINTPIVAGGVHVEPGDVIVADGDGAIRVPRARLAEVVDGARKRAEREAGIRSSIAGGARLFDIVGGPAALEAAGVTEIDDTWEATGT